jgi:hypothetical protein
MRQNPKREERQTNRSSPLEGPPREERQVRLPNQAAPVRRAENPPGPFHLQNGREAICQILSPYAAAQCMATRGLF